MYENYAISSNDEHESILTKEHLPHQMNVLLEIGIKFEKVDLQN